jgi:aconitate hydratase
MNHNLFDTLSAFDPGTGVKGMFYSLPALERAGIGHISRLPVSLRVVLESVLRNYDGTRITEDHIRNLAAWSPAARRTREIPFVVARILLQDFSGVPLLCDLAAMRSAARRLGKDPAIVEPLVTVDLVIDHSVQVDVAGTPDALRRNMELEFRRNRERYEFLKWGRNAFRTVTIVPPGIGISHQVNLEHLVRGVHDKQGLYYPDTLVGTDSHTTLINGIGVVGWGVGGIEAEACMLGQPLFILTPDVVGVNLTGALSEGATVTDLVLTVTELLRREKVVGAFVEFLGAGAATLSVPDRATVANMAPEYGATMGFFPVDDRTIGYFRSSGRSDGETEAFRAYFEAQGMFGMPHPEDIDYTKVLELDLSTIGPSVSGPKRPQDRIDLRRVKERFREQLMTPAAAGGFGKRVEELPSRFPADVAGDIGNGDVIIAAITSCTNTSNPSVLLAAGLLARKAVERGLTVNKRIKTSLTPGSRVVTEYLRKTGLLPYLEQLGFYLAAYGCTTCVGNSGPLEPVIEAAISRNDLVCAAVLSGNRNFEARIHPALRANFLMSPPLVVAYAIAGTLLWDPEQEPIGVSKEGTPVFLRDLWPTNTEVESLMPYAADPETFRRLYGDLTSDAVLWNAVSSVSDAVYPWPESTYIAEPPFFRDFTMQPEAPGTVTGARALAIFGDSLTTDHISPAGSIKGSSPAGAYLQRRGVSPADFQSYGTRRGNHEVMIRGTFAHVRIQNLLIPPKNDGTRTEGGWTLFQPSGELLSIFDAAMRYAAQGTPTVVFGGEEYGTGSSRDWAAKGTRLLGVKAVIARSFERIHRSNLVGMGVLPLQFMEGESVQTLGIRGDETFDIRRMETVVPQQDVILRITRRDGAVRDVPLRTRVDTSIEADYFLHGGILPYVLRGLLSG